ncbi:MAG TPA: hypothetical protein VMV48_04645 [Gallionellaceae bacterium]|nr:hypothetical protein [Gallionellaceae bacterium]
MKMHECEEFLESLKQAGIDIFKESEVRERLAEVRRWRATAAGAACCSRAGMARLTRKKSSAPSANSSFRNKPRRCLPPASRPISKKNPKEAQGSRLSYSLFNIDKLSKADPGNCDAVPFNYESVSEQTASWPRCNMYSCKAELCFLPANQQTTSHASIQPLVDQFDDLVL